MGANIFYTYAFGKTAKDAFRDAVHQAQWEHGHGGYTGTIAEKHDFVMLPKPDTRLSIRDLAGCSINNEEHYWVWRRLKEHEDAKDFDRTTSCMNRDGEWYTQVAERKKLPEKLVPWIRKAHQAVDNKWGPAGCVEITGKDAQEFRKREGYKGKQGKVFLFFGWASS